jgi:ABC-type dipeptide/oligopeptide/nickel transport system permease component
MLFQYILKRILIFVPTLFTISLVIFLLDKYMPGDPVLRGLQNEDLITEKIYLERWQSFNLNHPTFYFSFTSKAYPDTLHLIPHKEERTTLKTLTRQSGNWERTQAYFQAIGEMEKAVNSTKSDSTNADKLIRLRVNLNNLYDETKPNKIKRKFERINDIFSTTLSLNNLKTPFENLQNAYQNFQTDKTLWKNYLPSIQWHGLDNQYHIWVLGNKPWLNRMKDIFAISNKTASTSIEKQTIEIKENGYYKFQPNFDLIENNGRLTNTDLSNKVLFEVAINGKSKSYKTKDLDDTEVVFYAKKGEQIPIEIGVKPLTKSYQLKYNYSLTATQLLNYNPNKQSKGFLRGDFGKNFQLKPVSQIIKTGIFWTILISTISIVLTYLISIPLGVYSSRKKGTRADNILSTFLFMLYSLPNFWVATLLILFLGNYLGWFPVFGLGDIPEGASAMETASIRAYHLILPLFCWTYPSLAFLSRQMRGGMLNTLGQDFIRTARAKGLEEKTVIWKHAFRNSMLPIITLFANVFPRMVSGSIVVEVIFGIPGMGKILLDAINNNDFPIVFAIVMLTALLTMVGYLIADILYSVVDPRIKYK